jgi:MFS family permease
MSAEFYKWVNNAALAYLGGSILGVCLISETSHWRTFFLFSGLIALFWLTVARYRHKPKPD